MDAAPERGFSLGRAERLRIRAGGFTGPTSGLAPGGATDPIRAEMLPPEIGANAPALLNIDPTADIMGLPLREARDLFETQYLQAQLLRFGGNISRTAQFVGMERSALHRKLKQLGVNSDEKVGG